MPSRVYKCYLLIYKGMKSFSNIVIAFVAALLATSCVTTRRVDYLQDMTHGSQIEIENRFEAVIAPYDQLNITVMSSDLNNQHLAEPFNLKANQMGNGQQNIYGYLVDVNGDIELPTLGKVHVAGLTRLRLQDTLTAMLQQGGYIPDPYVNVRFSNFKIFFLGNGTGRVINITNERCTFLEALAMMGGLDNYTRRDRIAVMREINGRMVTRYLDPRSSDVFNDPFFMLQQNDFIIVPNYNASTLRTEFSYWAGLVTTAMSLASLLTSIALYRSIQ